MLFLFLLACNRTESAVTAAATELCTWGQLEGLTPGMLPATVDLAKTVRPADVRFAKDAEAKDAEALANNPFGGLAAAFQGSTKAIVEATAAHTTCEVEVKTEGGVPTAHVKRTVPSALDQGAGLVNIAELQALDTHEAKVAKVTAWLDAAKEKRTTEHAVRFVEVGDAWVADLGLPEAAIATAEAARATAQATVAKAEAARAELAKFEVQAARYYTRRTFMFTEPVIELTVKNGTPAAVSRAYFRGVVKSPERSVAWIDDTFNYEVPGGVEPGETVKWTLAPNMFSKWGTAKVPADAAFTVTVTKLDGADGNALYDAEGLDEAAAEIVKQDAEIARLRQAYLAG